jgi:hypothetical protein
VHQFHHEERTALVGGSGIQDLGDIGMVHERQRLALGLEASQHLLAVHTRPDDLEGHLPFDRFLLLGQIDHPAAAFADFLQQLVAPDVVAEFFSEQCGKDDLFAGRRWGGFLEEGAGLLVRLEEGFDVLTQLGILAAGVAELGGAVRRVRLLQGVRENLFNQLVAV